MTQTKPTNGVHFGFCKECKNDRFLNKDSFCEWVLRNCEEPVGHTGGRWEITPPASAFIRVIPGVVTYEVASDLIGQNWVAQVILQSDAALIASAPKLLALLEQYHQSFPSKESGYADL